MIPSIPNRSPKGNCFMKRTTRTTFTATAIAAVALVLLVATSPNANAQNESGRRSLNKPGFGGNWYDSTNAMYQYAFPIIRSLPPLNSSMPWDVMAGYIVADSIVRFDANGTTTETWLNSRRTMNDTLAGMIRFFYRMKEYNAATFMQYQTEVGLKFNSPERPYRASLRRIVNATKDALLRCAPIRTESRALYSALYADYILHVKVLAVDSMLLKPRPLPPGRQVFRATVEILDTLKGGAIPSCQQELSQDPDNKSARRARIATAAPCTYITFESLTTWDPRDYPENERDYYARDPAFCYSQTDSSFRMRAGQEAIVFIAYGNQRYDSTHDHFDPDITPFASFGALPVIDGRVRDVNKVWSNSLWMNYPDWRQRFFAIREKIITGKY